MNLQNVVPVGQNDYVVETSKDLVALSSIARIGSRVLCLEDNKVYVYMDVNKWETALDLAGGPSNATHWAGVTTTALTDGATTDSIVINGENVAAELGAMVSYGPDEFVWNGSAWQKFGGDSETFRVTVTNNTADRTFADTLAAFNAGKFVYAIINSQLYLVDYGDNNRIVFYKFGVNNVTFSSSPGVVNRVQQGFALQSNDTIAEQNNFVLPQITSSDNGKVLGVNNGVWDKMAAPSGLPPVTGSDNGKVLAVENGSWAAANPAYMKEVTYAELKAMRDGGTLTPGMQYRMTDYTTIITGSYDLSVIGASGYLHNARSAGHAFDLILLATGTGELSEVARAALHSGDTYFSGVDIDAWELRYCLDNNTAKFAFANSSGKGVIYWMRDEWNNQAGYDFKNVQFLRYAMSLNAANPDAVDTGLVYDASKQPNRYAGMMQIYSVLNGYMESGSYVNPWGATGNYDFAVSYNILGAVQMAQPDAAYLATFKADWYYTFDFYGDLDDVGTDAHYDASLNQHPWIPCRENYIELETNPVAALLLQEHNHVGLGGSVWETNGVFLGSFSSNSHWNFISENRLGQNNFGNTFGNLCYGIITKNDCHSNTLGNNCHSNTFGNNCYNNTFGNNCYNNTFGNNCSRNQLQGTFSYLRVSDSIKSVTLPSTMQDADHPKEMVNYYANTNGEATWIVHTGYNTETAVSTTDGGTTWA